MKPENKLFATLDVTYHGTSLLNSNQNIIFADTIGFISDIPHNLIEAFKTSLLDTLEGDLFIHLIDLSHPNREAQEKTVQQILSELAPENKMNNIIKVYNKCDKLESQENTTNVERNENTFFISCKSSDGLAELRNQIEKRVFKMLGYIEICLKVSQGGEEWFFLNKNAIIKEVTADTNNDCQYVSVRVMLNKVNAKKFVNLFPLTEVSK